MTLKAACPTSATWKHTFLLLFAILVLHWVRSELFCQSLIVESNCISLRRDSLQNLGVFPLETVLSFQGEYILVNVLDDFLRGSLAPWVLEEGIKHFRKLGVKMSVLCFVWKRTVWDYGF